MRHTLNFSTADLHEERQSALSIASASNSEGAIPQRFNVDLRQSLYRL